MKNVLIIACFLLSLTACKQDGATSTSSATPTVSPEVTPEPAKPATATNSTPTAKKGSELSIADKAAEYNTDEAKKARKVKRMAEAGFDTRLPDACDLVSPATVAGLVNTDANAIEIKDGSNANSKNSRSCFFKWDDPGMTNAGVMVQVMTNPVADEVPEYLRLFIESKKTAGEQAFNTNENYKYKDFDGFGDDGAYSYDLHKYIWRQGEEFSFMVAFNTTLQERAELAAAKKIATEVMRNFK